MRSLALVLTALAAITACSADPADRPAAATTPSPSPAVTASGRPLPSYTWTSQPSPLVLRLADRDVALRPWTSCWSGPPDEDGVAPGRCADGSSRAVEDLPPVSGLERLDFWFGRPGWRFTARFLPAARIASGAVGVRGVVRSSGAREFTLTPPDLAPGTYRVDLFGRGPEGTYPTSFRWS